MHIVLLGSAYPYRGGIAHFTETLASSLQLRGHTVEIVTFTRQYPDKLFPGKTQFEQKSRQPRVKIERYVDAINPRSWTQTAQIIADKKPDALIVQHWMPFFAPAFGMIARSLRKKGIPTFVVVHNPLPHEKRFGDKALTRFLFRASQGLMVLAQKSEGVLRSLGIQQPIRFSPHPIYDMFGEAIPQTKARKKLKIPPKTKVLLFFGMIRRYKGLQTLLQALPQVIQALPDVHLVVAGECYEDAELYQSIIEQPDLKAHLSFHANYIPNEAVATYFSAADVVVQPYLSATQSGVTQIALQFDKPSIVTNVGALPEAVPHEKAGFVVPPDNAAALAEAIIRFFQDDWQSNLTEGVKAQKEAYSWDVFCTVLEEMIENKPQ